MPASRQRRPKASEVGCSPDHNGGPAQGRVGGSRGPCRGRPGPVRCAGARPSTSRRSGGRTRPARPPHIQPALVGALLGDVGYPQPVRSWWVKLCSTRSGAGAACGRGGSDHAAGTPSVIARACTPRTRARRETSWWLSPRRSAGNSSPVTGLPGEETAALRGSPAPRAAPGSRGAAAAAPHARPWSVHRCGGRRPGQLGGPTGGPRSRSGPALWRPGRRSWCCG